jgi:membrane protein implicated in regulation of membrane protease activity
MRPVLLFLKEKTSTMEILSNPAVIWFLIGLGLLLLELVLPGLVILFFGVGAWVTALVCAFFELNINWQILIFLLSSLLGLILLRRYLKRKFFSRSDTEVPDELEEYIGHKAKALEDFKDGMGRIEFKGSPWTAQCSEPVAEGQWVTIESKESLVLHVKPG